MAQNVATDTMKANAKLANDVGYEATVTRIYDRVGVHTQKGGKYRKECQWCLARCGTDVPYPDAIANDMFRRHPGCGCEIRYTVNGRTQVQTDWRRNQWENEDAVVDYNGIPKSWDSVGEESSEVALKGANPNYKTDLPKHLHGTIDDYTHNCSNAVVAYEMRRRGYPVTACSLGENRRLRNKPFTAWIGRDPVATHGTGENEIRDFLLNEKAGVRVEITVKYPKTWFDTGREGHAFIAEKRNEEVVYLDPQSGKIIDKNIFNRVEKDATMYMRIDDLEISDRGVSACKREGL